MHPTSHGIAAVAIVEPAGGESALESHLAHIALAEALRRRGRLVEALAQIGRALHATGRHSGSVYHAFALAIRAQVDLAMRDRRAARTHAAAARRIVDRYPDVGVLAERLASVEQALELPRRSSTSESEPTAAERRVLRLLSTDLTRRQIAAELGLSVATVKSPGDLKIVCVPSSSLGVAMPTCSCTPPVPPRRLKRERAAVWFTMRRSRPSPTSPLTGRSAAGPNARAFARGGCASAAATWWPTRTLQPPPRKE